MDSEGDIAAGKGGRVRRRRVFYIPGYDPIPPRRYREIYRRQAAAQAAVSGHEIDLKPGAGGGVYGWHVEARIEGAPVQADFEVLVWSDLVRDSMSNGIAATYLQLVRTAWIYVGSGAFGRLMRLRKGPAIAALYPVGMLIAQLVVALAAGLLAGLAVAALALSALARVPAPWNLAPVAAAVALAVAVAAVAAVAVLRWFRARDNRLYAYYLMHDYAHTAQARGAYPPDLERRLAEFGHRIASALMGDADEVLLVGHSSGAHLGVSVLADLIRAGRVPATGPALGFLSLGQVVPMVAFLPDAWRLRADLRYLSARNELSWIDVTAPGDGCAFALCDPVAVSGVAPRDQRWPLVLSAAFTQTLSPERWKALRWRFLRLHFQYLCAFDRPGDYDYFRLTAGPQTLAARYHGRAPSKSLIARAVSKYRSVAA